MPRQIPYTIVEAVTKPETYPRLLALLRIRHAGEELRCVNSYQADARTVGVWNPLPFSVSLPADGTSSVPSLNVNVMNVTLEVSAFAKCGKAVGGRTSLKVALF